MTIQEATADMFRRYNQLMQTDSLNEKKLPSEINLRCTLMGIHAISHSELPVDKLSRWLGFVQGCLYSHGLIDLSEERKISRELFHQAYKDQGIEPPESIDIVEANFESMADN